MEIKLTLALPRDGVSVPIVRRILRGSMEALGIEPEVTADIELALTEACTNVLDHAREGDDYEVSAGIDGTTCIIEVVDHGSGFDASLVGQAEAAPSAEEGRGVRLMRQLVDKVEFETRQDVGSVVHMEKELIFPKGSAIDQLTDGMPKTHGPWSRREQMEDAPQPSGPL